MSSTREKVLAALKRNAKTKGAFDAGDDLRGMTTGCLAADIISGIGGFPVGRLTEVFGWESSGKTTLCLTACAEAQRRGTYVAYIDVERGVSLSHARNLGFVHDDEDLGLYITPSTFEETMEIVQKLAETGEVPFIVVDSVPAMVPESELDDMEKAAIGHKARLLSLTLPKLTKIIEDKNVTLVLVNQMRMKVDVGGFKPSFMVRKEDTETSSGGSAIKFYSSLRLDCTLTKKGSEKVETVDMFTGREIKVPTANEHTVKAFKNKVGSPYRTGTFVIRYNPDATPPLFGIDNLFTAMSIAVVHGIIDKGTGGRYTFKTATSDLSAVGEASFLEQLRQNTAMSEDLMAHVRAIPEIAEVLARQV